MKETRKEDGRSSTLSETSLLTLFADPLGSSSVLRGAELRSIALLPLRARRTAASGPPNKDAGTPSLTLHPHRRCAAGSCRRSAPRSATIVNHKNTKKGGDTYAK